MILKIVTYTIGIYSDFIGSNLVRKLKTISKSKGIFFYIYENPFDRLTPVFNVFVLIEYITYKKLKRLGGVQTLFSKGKQVYSKRKARFFFASFFLN